jgi:hypothetical protein
VTIGCLPGKLDRWQLSFSERAVVLGVRAAEGDFRDWAKSPHGRRTSQPRCGSWPSRGLLSSRHGTWRPFHSSHA